MIRRLLRSALRPILGKRKAAAAAEAIDGLAKREIDRRTGGAATRLDEVV